MGVEAGRGAALARGVTALNARWDEVTHCVYGRHRVLDEAWHETGELRAWLAQEAAWLDGLERRLRRDPALPADAEDLAHDLTDLENYVADHSAARLDRIQHVGRQLADALIMPDWIRAEVDAVTQRWDALREQAAARARDLERLGRDAAQFELTVDALQQWLARAQAALDQRPAPQPALQVRTGGARA